MVGNDTDLIVLLLHNTKDMELNSEHSKTILSHQGAAIGLINCLISYVTPILYLVIYIPNSFKLFKGVSMYNLIYYINFNFYTIKLCCCLVYFYFFNIESI